MALLKYANLQVDEPRTLLQHTFNSLSTYHKYLKRTKSFMESDAAVRRLAFREVKSQRNNEDQADSEGAVWVELAEPLDRPNEPEQTFALFLDENTSEVYESPAVSTSTLDRKPQRIEFSNSRKIDILDRDPKTNQIKLERLPEENFRELSLRPNTYTIRCQIRAIEELQNAPSPEHLPLLRLFMPREEANWPEFYVNSEDDLFVDDEYELFEDDVWYDNLLPTPNVNPDFDWKVLTDSSRPGTNSQRIFVKKARNTPDFAILEGPPGSGKTTAICELILQLVLEGKRVLLCASTHVAVDNVLERLMTESNPHREHVVPIRIGNQSNVSDFVKKWRLEEFMHTEKKRLKDHLKKQEEPNPAQQNLLKALQAEDNNLIQRLVLETANLVCGTTIGILQHPKIKERRRERKSVSPEYDVLIVDEASKTTFQEFLVPALLAKRWVVVGDPKQLSPYVDDQAMAVNVESCLQDPLIRQACMDVFFVKQKGRKYRSTLILTEDERRISSIYEAQATERDVDLAFLSTSEPEPQYASMLLCQSEKLPIHMEKIPLDLSAIRGTSKGWEFQTLLRRVGAWRRLNGITRNEEPKWEEEVGWRLARHFEQRFHPGRSSQRLFTQVQELLPSDGTGLKESVVWKEIDRVRRVALPSILELLQSGFQSEKAHSLEDLEPGMLLSGRIKNITDFGAFVDVGLGKDGLIHISNLSRGRVEHPSEVVHQGQRVTVEVLEMDFDKERLSLDLRGEERNKITAMTEGLPEYCLEQRHELLEFQHRMHPDISSFPREYIYESEALWDADDMEEKRLWNYPRYEYRSIWLDVRGRFDKRNRNREEAKAILRELQDFRAWVGGSQHPDGRPWEVAILTFYRGQEREIREHLRQVTGKRQAFRHFIFGPKEHPEVNVSLCTVDRFQGHEADLVFLSFANTYPTVFLESPNRLNVALTRARYQLVVVGNRGRLGWRDGGKKERDCGPVLRALLDEAKVDYRWSKGGKA